MSVFAGIDYDSNRVVTALVHEDTGQLLAWNRVDLACGPGDSFDRARRVRDLMPARGKWTDTGVLAVGIEDPFTHQLNSLVAQIRVQGAILSCLPRDLLVLPLPPNRKAPLGWKALVGLPTNADKVTIRGWALDQGAPGDLTEHEYDAFAIARATRELWQTRRQRAA